MSSAAAKTTATKTDPAIAVADYGEGGETKNTTTFYHLGNAVYRYQFFQQVVVTRY